MRNHYWRKTKEEKIKWKGKFSAVETVPVFGSPVPKVMQNLCFFVILLSGC